MEIRKNKEMYELIILIFFVLLSGCYSNIGKQTTERDDPCNDKILKQLEQKDSLTTEEMHAYIELKRLCNESQNNSARLKQVEESTNTISTYLWISLFVGVIAAIYIIDHPW